MRSQNDHCDFDAPFGKLYDGSVRYFPRATDKRRKHYGGEQAVLWGPCSEDEFKQRERTDQRSFDLAPPNRQLAKHIRDHRLSERRRNAFSARQIYAE